MSRAVMTALMLVGAAGLADKKADAEFVQKASGAGLAEVELSKLALDKSKDVNVRQFAQLMVDDHGKANVELMRTANKKSDATASALPADAQKNFDDLKTLEGTSFDRKYVAVMVKDHKDAVSLFEKEAKNGKDADYQRFASETLPHLKHHLDMIQVIQSDLKSAR